MLNLISSVWFWFSAFGSVWNLSADRYNNLTFSCKIGQTQFCSTPGHDYPWDGIKQFMEDNHGTMRRMFGDAKNPAGFAPETTTKVDRRTASPSAPTGATSRRNPCPVNVRVEQPYWSANQKGNVRVIVNHEPFQQFVQIETCRDDESEGQSKCPGSDCSCMQEYRLIRLVAYDPSQEEKGVFMDWFEFPACCQCKCVQGINETTSHLDNRQTQQDESQL